MQVRLYTIPGSHPGVAAQLTLRHKRIEFERTDLMPVFSRALVRVREGLSSDLMPVFSRAMLKAQRFPGVTAPAMKVDGKRVQGSREIARELDRLRPEPPLFPGDPDHYPSRATHRRSFLPVPRHVRYLGTEVPQPFGD